MALSPATGTGELCVRSSSRLRMCSHSARLEVLVLGCSLQRWLQLGVVAGLRLGSSEVRGEGWGSLLSLPRSRLLRLLLPLRL